MSGTLARARAAHTDGLLAAPLEREGAWGAIRSLRQAMRRLRQTGLEPRVEFILGLGARGELTSLSASSLLLLGYGPEDDVPA